MGMSAGGGAGAAPNINVTPLIDILLVLLIIFMVITPLRPARFKTLIPERAENPDEKMSPRTLVVSVEGAGTLKLIRGATTVAEASVEEPGESGRLPAPGGSPARDPTEESNLWE